MVKSLYILLVFTSCFSISSAQMIHWGEAKNGIDFGGDYILNGELTLVRGYGPSNFGEIPNIDKYFIRWY